ncbi:hypothetical protein T06_13335 [Trichinella sp. T6]|nr:hypothetical protein T06_13335 [Trichinella sp. T6]
MVGSKLSRETRNQKPPGYVCCTLLIFSDPLMPIKSIFGEKAFHGLHGFMDLVFFPKISENNFSGNCLVDFMIV